MLRAPADAAVVTPAGRAVGRIRLPGDKSISHRYALLAAIADGPSRIDGYSPGADCAATLACLAALGVPVARQRGNAVQIEGRGPSGFRAPAAPLNAENSGTTLRLLSGLLAGQRFRSIIGGDASLSRRPMRRVIDPLTKMGARVSADDGRPPLTIDGGPLRGLTHRPDVASAQVKSAVLLAGVLASGRTEVHEPAATRDHTERALLAFGVRVESSGLIRAVQGGQPLRAGRFAVPGDISGAAFWGVLAAAWPGSVVDIEAVGLNPSRTAWLEVVQRAGARVDVHVQQEHAGEPIGRVRVAHETLRSFAIAPDEVPGLIDEIPALAALGALLPDGSVMEVRRASELRVKESDRITSLAAGLRALGAHVDEFPDGFRIAARRLTGATVDAVGDHRLAMAFAIAATGAATPTTIAGASSVDVSYPGFFAELARLTSATAGGESSPDAANDGDHR